MLSVQWALGVRHACPPLPPAHFYNILSSIKESRYKMDRATLAEKEVTTLKEQLATTSPVPLQATVPPKTNGSHIESTRDQATETRIQERLSPDIKEEKRRSPEIDEDIEHKIEMAATGRSNSNSTRSSPVINQGSNLEIELAAKEKELKDAIALWLTGVALAQAISYRM
ncbi:hypothetical protein RR48_05135 [Papilio machaon]|uniref:Uncharacterized protein n=1 Tax=Papilio machaon TaxID=76193 RepID=A0A0N1PHT0_PAPMA|nr:hypothetical protein RR48_05135 [Papilio machaon]